MDPGAVVEHFDPFRDRFVYLFTGSECIAVEMLDFQRGPERELVKEALERGLQAEMTSHLGYEPVRPANREGAYSGRNLATFSRNARSENGQSTRSPITEAGIRGHCANKARTRPSNASNFETLTLRSYTGGRSDLTARATVLREIPKSRAITASGTPSRARTRISSQSCTRITLHTIYEVLNFQLPLTPGVPVTYDRYR